ncbi:MAG TPA: hypothetical protein PKH33_18430 [bacterium]|nr:hypothetical protein [bacterium]
MVSLIRNAAEALVRKLQADATPNTVLVPINDHYEIKQVPSLLAIGPKMEENRSKRIYEKRVETDRVSLAYSERNWPRFYHLDFDLVLTTGNGMELLDLQERLTAFFLDNISLSIPCAVGWGLGPYGIEPWGSESGDLKFYLRELVPMGGLERPNLSNLRQASGRYRIEDVPVFDHALEQGKLVVHRDFVLCDSATRSPVETFSR